VVRLSELIDASPAIISLIDLDRFEVRFQNATGRAQLGTITGVCCYQAIAQQETVCRFCRGREALATGRATEAEVPLPDGRWLLVQWAPVLPAAGSGARAGRPLAVETISDITGLKRREQELARLRDYFERLALRDPLTDLLNRRGWMAMAERTVQRAGLAGVPVTVLMVDLDHFKAINDQYGHDGGDAVLRQTAAVLQSAVRSTDLVGRLGGEEFAVLPTPAEAGDESAHQVGERLRAAVAGASYLLPSGETCSVTASVGVATGRVGSDAAEALMALLSSADKALYAAKALGRNRCVVAEEPDPPRTAL
jgi:diguanylate cyclase (GGDEF)-like protein